MAKRSIYCTICDVSVQSNAFSAHLRSTTHKNNGLIEVSSGIEKISSAFRSRIASYRVHAEQGGGHEARPPSTFLRSLRHRVRSLLDACLVSFHNIKANFELFAEFSLPKNETLEIKSFATENMVIHKSYDFHELFSRIVNTISTKIDEFEERDSGWAFAGNLYLEININKYNPLRAA
jgi:hypothetical protein